MLYLHKSPHEIYGLLAASAFLNDSDIKKFLALSSVPTLMSGHSLAIYAFDNAPMCISNILLMRFALTALVGEATSATLSEKSRYAFRTMPSI